ncbi:MULTISPECIES: hypothetical protein [unclassified Streptomyces]|uniref:RNA polymerase sigma factor n=1 Tax=unclassified Streptomyces TaxID=2593676 RepID=UPI0003600490|nr:MULTISPECIES: hypothetical protein [unclassified Streptomyces]MYX36055.1 hypothetical protein [Streptomyces sp. SID8377]
MTAREGPRGHETVEEWFEAHADRVMGYLLHRTDRETAQDVLSETFLPAWISGLPSDAVKEFDQKDPGAVCARRWKEMWGPSEPVPASFAACYYPGGTGKVVWPADGLGQDEACARIGARPIPAG